jgi:uncharacterized protein YqgC (DUF456 family)
MNTVIDVLFITMIGFFVVSNFLGIPGNSLIALSGLFYGVINKFEVFSASYLLLIIAIVLVVEALEFILLSITLKKYGASKTGIAGGIVVGIIGAISGAFVTPVIGAVVGSFVGVIFGTFFVEYYRSSDLRKSIRATMGVLIGRLAGLSIKTIGSVTAAVMLAYKIV